MNTLLFRLPHTVSCDYFLFLCAEGPGADYIGSNGTLIIRAPACSASARVAINDDAVFEGREHFSFVLSTNQPRVQVNNTLSHGNIYIVDNDGKI